VTLARNHDHQEAVPRHDDTPNHPMPPGTTTDSEQQGLNDKLRTNRPSDGLGSLAGAKLAGRMKRRREGGRPVQESPRFRRVTQRTVGESGPDPIDADADGQAGHGDRREGRRPAGARQPPRRANSIGVPYQHPDTSLTPLPAPLPGGILTIGSVSAAGCGDGHAQADHHHAAGAADQSETAR